MANFNESLAYVIKNETAKYTNYKHDLPTKYGITIDTLSEYLTLLEEQMGSKTKVTATIEDVKNITYELAITIYDVLYWRRLCLAMVNDNNIATAILDIGVNCGVGTVAGLVQTCLNMMGFNLAVDDLMGMKTCEALDEVDRKTFIQVFENMVVVHYHEVVRKNPKKAPNLAGWLARAGRLMSLI